MNIQTNFSLVERVQGHGPAIGQEELLDLLAELAALSAKKLTDCSTYDIYRFKTLKRWLSCTSS